MSFNVYHNPQSVQLGALPITGVVAVAVGQSFGEIHAAADDDMHESVARYTTGRTGGTITLLDPVQAAAAANATGTLTFTWKDTAAGDDKTVTIANCSTGNWETAVGRDKASMARLHFIAESAPVIS